MPSLTIHGKEYVIAKLFSGDDFAFIIPEYQRPYAWTTEQADELLSDLLAMMGDDESANVEDLQQYFLGSIVLIKNDGQAESVVVDGQQRLTTLTILLSALRETLKDDGLTSFLYQKKQEYVLGTEDRYRLLLRDEDQDFLKKHVQEDGGFQRLLRLDVTGLTDSQRNIVKNGRYFHQELSKQSRQRQQQLVRFVLNRCVLIVVTSPDRDAAYRIFSILNDRGLDLSHTDILKAEVIGKMGTANSKAYARKWVDLENDLGREAFEDLFGHVRMIYRRAKMRESVLKEFREHVCKSHTSQELVDDVLIPYGEAYKTILDEAYESTSRADEVNELLSWLNRLDNVDWVPPAITYLKDHRNDPDRLITFLTSLEQLAASMFIRRVNITKRIERYASVLKDHAEGKDLYADGSPLQLTNDEKQATRDALEDDLYKLPRVPLYVLLRLDAALSDGSATYNYKTISIEHVLPQTPAGGSEWLDLFPDEDLRQGMTHKIGNLVLLNRRKNTSASNYDFDKKKDKYFRRNGVCPFPLTTEVLSEPVWTPAVVQARQKRLVNTLADVWKLN